MKTRSLFFVIILLSAVSVSFAGDKISVDQFYGTWINENYNEYRYHHAKVIFNPDGPFAYYENINDTKPKVFGTFILKDSWVDSEGNIWILEDEYVGTYFEGKKVSHYYINKISNSGRTLESFRHSSNVGQYPEEKDLNPNDSWYRVHYRQ
jgi:hypothetical protein